MRPNPIKMMRMYVIKKTDPDIPTNILHLG